MPRLSDTMETGVVVTWHKQTGEMVEAGEILADIETDKAVMEYEAYESGVLGRILVAEGEEAAIGQPIAVIGDEEDADDAAAPDEAAESQASASPPPAQSGTVDDAVQTSVVVPAMERMPASPLARRDAAELGVDLTQVVGTGPGERIIRADVRAAAQATPAEPETPVAQEQNDGEEVPLSLLRRTSGKRLADSARTAPHFYLTASADLENLVDLRFELNAQLTEAGRQKVSINDLVIRACALTLRQHPDVNSSLSGHNLLRHHDINIGVAVAIDDGLLVPVIRNADHKSVGVIAEESAALAVRARQRQLTTDEMAGGTFTISNLGMYGVEQFTAIINPPQAAILAVGASRREAVVLDDGSLAARTRMRYTLSADHRILNGADGARFLADLTHLLEHPWLIIA
ncbi:2-oxo acid dehydrogenase subunit E2 [Kribbella capetownensis]|uniref:Dihydrolipoamide acetyltransferase component of pyruvate dehydrogenase complex n=2 Tax=Kribbella capetownensis TaxID=1572659 RepID=A0A4R0JGK8_9ACTN|nr:2-oxo acid dehydrogenase subunit E2 [Kribbella capetownensis]